MDQIQAQVFAVLQNVLLALITVLGGMAVRYIQQHFTAKQLNNAKGIAQIAVSSVEQISKSLGINGPQKLTAAVSQAETLAAKVGIKLTTEQWNSLIHDTLAEFKKIWDTVTKPVVNPESVATQPKPAPAGQLSGRWVLGDSFICHFPQADQKTPNQFFTPTTTTPEEFEKLKVKVGSYAEKTEQSLADFYASINTQA